MKHSRYYEISREELQKLFEKRKKKLNIITAIIFIIYAIEGIYTVQNKSISLGVVFTVLLILTLLFELGYILIQNISYSNILYFDCDPVKYKVIVDLLKPSTKIDRNFIRSNKAILGMYVSEYRKEGELAVAEMQKSDPENINVKYITLYYVEDKEEYKRLAKEFINQDYNGKGMANFNVICERIKASLYFDEGRYQEAIEIYEKQLVNERTVLNKVIMSYHLAKNYKMMGENEKAVTFYKYVASNGGTLDIKKEAYEYIVTMSNE